MTRRNRKRSEASSEGGLAIDKLLEEIRDEKEKEYETVDDLNKGGIDAHSRCRKRLRTTGALDILGHFRDQSGGSTERRGCQRVVRFRRKRYFGRVHLSLFKRQRSCAGAARE